MTDSQIVEGLARVILKEKNTFKFNKTTWEDLVGVGQTMLLAESFSIWRIVRPLYSDAGSIFRYDFEQKIKEALK